jgi:heat shock protein HslJ
MIVLAAVFASIAAVDPSAATESYHARAADGSWSLSIADGQMTFSADSRQAVVVATPSPDQDNISRRYAARPLTVDILPGASCAVATGERYADTVFITSGRRSYEGCGGRILAPDDLTDTSWYFAEIGGARTELTGDILRDDRYAVDFGADAFVGYGGCNRFSAHYRVVAGILTIHEPWGTTRGTCAEPVMSRERRLMEILRASVRVSFPDQNTLLLTGESGTIRLVRGRSGSEAD